MRSKSFRAPRALFLALFLALVGRALFAPAEARAATTRLNLGAHYWFVETGLFDASLSIEAPVASIFSVGGRFGILFTSSDPTLGVPLDLLLRLRLASPVYVEVAGGPWFFFEGDNIRGHFGVGVGFQSGPISFGPELSYLEPRAMLGGRFSYRF